MMRVPFDIPRAIDLTDFYPTREELNRAIHRIRKRLTKCQSFSFFTAVFVGFSIRIMIDMIIDQRKRIDNLETILNKKDRTAE